MPTRRDCLKGSGLAAAALAASGCAGLPRDLSQQALPDGWMGGAPEAADGRHDLAIARTLGRASFGPRPGELRRVREIGLDAYLEEQLHPEQLDESPAVGWRLWRLDTLQVDTDFRYDFPKEQVQAELQQAAVVRAAYSRRQLQEVMVDFWTDHFNISQRKGDSAFLKSADDDAVVRRHALGKFRELLWASAKSPAMLYYLDNCRNTRTAGNENYAREVMELHTLGVSGGYTQCDVQEVARCFTGWSLRDSGTWWNGTFAYQPEQHDDGPRHVLGVLLPPGLGHRHGERVLEILADHPSTAHFIARKLCRRFVADEGSIPVSLVERLAGVFRRSDGDIRQVLGVLLRSDEFRYGRARKLKRPLDFAISALRALNADTDGQGVLPHLRSMGQVPYQWAMPNGYPDAAEDWLPGLLARWNFAIALVSGQIGGTNAALELLLASAGAKSTGQQAAALQSAILGHARTENVGGTVAELLRHGTPDGLAQAAALLLVAPPFQWR
jgi:uncharacterized protein (DUF1800 family)